MTKLLDGQAAVITGGASGNGRAIARRFAEHGADVVIADRREHPRQDGQPTAELIKDEYEAAATYLECDVRNPDDLRAAVDVAEQFGGLDIIVNNAGILRETPFLEVDEDEFDDILGVNLKGVYFGAQAAARRMREHDREGCIVNIASGAGHRGAANSTAYSASKGGVVLLTYALAAELGPQIRVNAVSPGYIRTAMTAEDIPLTGTAAEETLESRIPMGRLGDPGDIADATLFLASDLADYVTGEALVVDGGDANTV